MSASQERNQNSNQDPRVYFAAERTFLAWVRSGITMIALGFVVAKFGLFMTLMGQSATEAMAMNTAYSNIMGILLVVIGVIMVLVAHFNHQYYIKTLPPEKVPTLPIRWLSGLLTYAIAIASLLLAAYLFFL